MFCNLFANNKGPDRKKNHVQDLEDRTCPPLASRFLLVSTAA
jgi:hypothetical protein